MQAINTAQILVVEDEAIVAMDLQSGLKRLGYPVAGVASSASEAIHKAETTHPDLVLMDIVLRGPSDGVEAAAAIATRLGIPIIFLTSHADEATLQRAKVTSPFGYLLKPFEMRELHIAIDMALYKHKVERELRENELALQRVSAELELRVRERTADLAAANQALTAEIAERRAAQEALARSQHLLQALFEHSPDAIVVTDAAGRLVRVNEQALTVFGYGREELLGQPVEILIPERAREGHVHQRARFVTEARARPMGTRQELFGRRKDGSEFPAQVVLGPLDTDAGLLVLGVVRDITEQKKLEEQFRQAQKMEAVGQLAGGVAHDFNNLLTIITGYGELVHNNMHPSDPSAAMMQEIRSAGERATALTRQLLAFSRKQVLSPEPLDLNVLVAGMEKMLARLIGEDVQMLCVPGPNLHPVLADRGKFELILMNLAINARDAMPLGGRLTISTGNVVCGGVHPSPRTEMPPGDYVRLTVTDTGNGMDAHTLAHLFEPFFTTKEIGKGTGLGLAAVYGSVKQSGGFLDVVSEPARGATFTIYLPAAAGSAPRRATDSDVVDLPRGTETILLVEDADAVRSLTRRILEAHGYTILAAHQGAEALRVLEQHAGPVHLLLTDVVMPEMGGPELVRRLTTLRPEIKVLFMTGYTKDRTIFQGLAHDTAHVLDKPFTPVALVRMVRTMLDK